MKQVYALAAALCVRMGEEFPESRLEASDLIQRVWDENGDPRARLHPSASLDLGEVMQPEMRV